MDDFRFKGFDIANQIHADNARRAHDMQKAIVDLAELAHARSPKGMVEQILGEIQAFETNLATEFAPVLLLLGAAREISLQLQFITAYESGLIVFNGTSEDGAPARLLQHVTQVSFALTSVRRADVDSPRPPIGFQIIPA